MLNRFKASPSFMLFMARVAMVVLFLPWTLDKFITPDHTAKIFEKFYLISGLDVTISYGIGTLQLVIIGLFLLGLFKNVTYLIMFLMHTVSVFSTYQQLLHPLDGNLLFVAGAALWFVMLGLYLARDHDTMMVFKIK